MRSRKNIFLVGMMGAGKTTIGRQLAKVLDLRFVDVDEEIELQTGVSIPVIFDIEGDAGFRQRESKVLRTLAKENGIVLATGGGAILDPENRNSLANNGTVVYLNIRPKILAERLRHDRKRPLLQVGNRADTLADLHARRDSLYRQVADIVIECNGESPQRLARVIEDHIQAGSRLP